MSSPHNEPIPRAALIGAAVLIATAFGAAAYGRLNADAAAGVETQQVALLASRDLIFRDGEDGSVQVIDAQGDDVVFVAAPGTNGFIRGVMRGMARHREMRDIGAAAPFRLTMYVNGRLSLTDPETDRTIELNAFGADNRDAFARLLVGA
jgi:putative photosynthetic complex assembly protein